MMTKALPLAGLLGTILLTGCAIQHPQNAQEFRQALPGATFGKKETYIVERDFRIIGKTFEKMAPKCLHKRVTSTSSGYMHYQVITTDYNPTVLISKQRAELHLQQDHIQGVMNVSKKPNGGYFMMVVDASPAGKNKSQIEIYAPSVGSDKIIQAVKGWTTGKTIGCPDLTQ